MMRGRWGRIIFMSSVVGEMGNVGQTAYAATKAALIGAAKLDRARVRVAQRHGQRHRARFIDTDMTATMTRRDRRSSS